VFQLHFFSGMVAAKLPLQVRRMLVERAVLCRGLFLQNLACISWHFVFILRKSEKGILQSMREDLHNQLEGLSRRVLAVRDSL
jgi:hypothetical protein